MSFFEIEMVNKIDSSLLCRYISLFHIFSYSSICFEIFSNTFFQGFYRLTMLKKFFFLHFMEKIDRLFYSALLSCRICVQILRWNGINSITFSHIELFLALFFCPKNNGLVVIFSFLLLRPLKKAQILDSWH